MLLHRPDSYIFPDGVLKRTLYIEYAVWFWALQFKDVWALWESGSEEMSGAG